MKISDLVEGMSNIELDAKVVEIGETRNVNTRFGPNRVSDAIIEDDTGRVKLTLWGPQIDMIKNGDDIHISGGYVRSWQGELQLSVPRRGKIALKAGATAAEALEEIKKVAGAPEETEIEEGKEAVKTVEEAETGEGKE